MIFSMMVVQKLRMALLSETHSGCNYLFFIDDRQVVLDGAEWKLFGCLFAAKNSIDISSQRLDN